MKFNLYMLGIWIISQSAFSQGWTKYEAEEAILSGDASVSNDPTASGQKFVNIGSSGRIDFMVNVPKKDQYLIRFSSKSSSPNSRSFENIFINDEKIIEQHYSAGFFWDPSATGHYTVAGERDAFASFKSKILTYGDPQDPWQMSEFWWGHTGEKRNNLMIISLNQGTNKISVVKNWGGTKWDYLEIDKEYPFKDLNVSYNIDVNKEKSLISPYIYGSSVRFDVVDDALTMMRFGGNHTTPYNWENNYNNAGKDWLHSSGRLNWPTGALPSGKESVPGSVVTHHHDRSLARGLTSLVALSMIGYVAADGNGVVTEAETAPSSRWKKVIYKKNAPFSQPAGSPDLNDNYVYSDEFVNFLVDKYGNASTETGIKFYALDNEPRLWNTNHVRIHPEIITGEELVEKSSALASAVKDVDPYAKIFGPVFYGIWPMYDLQNKENWEKIKKDYSWFVDYYLDEMKKESDKNGRRLVDVFAFHHYSHTKDSINDDYYFSRMQSPRTLWDKDYNSDPLLLKVQNSIFKYNPGTGIGITEWAFGGDNHVSGGIATADVLGIFGKLGVFQSSYWTLKSETVYPNAAFRLFRNYDGNRSQFGDTKVFSESSDKINSSLYASISSVDNGKIHLIVLNKNLNKAISGDFQVNNISSIGSIEVWGFDEKSHLITERITPVEINGNSFKYSIPPLSAYHFVLEGDYSTKLEKINIDPEIKQNLFLAINSSAKDIKINYSIDNSEFIQIDLYDLNGKKIKSLFSGHADKGQNELKISIKNISKGTYYFKMKTNSGSITRIHTIN
jgi:mannan endo-1,4-beta-mannosidase